ncbi:hypothetical protein [Phaffia rhodozyma]|uniref:Uncharacterized protein n=1 Tax=Phaffia rhodozyma TaxID=264483 RepID=A0A0F7SXK9_PHARH|nr:hypothetical protein [Phaffia rhodozyma]
MQLRGSSLFNMDNSQGANGKTQRIPLSSKQRTRHADHRAGSLSFDPLLHIDGFRVQSSYFGYSRHRACALASPIIHGFLSITDPDDTLPLCSLLSSNPLPVLTVDGATKIRVDCCYRLGD